MVKIGLIIKQETEKILNSQLRGAESVLLVKYSGLTASDLNCLRSLLSAVDSRLMVAKNSVSKRVFKNCQDLNKFLDGPCGIVFVNKDLISTSRVIFNFIKGKPNLEVKAGILKDRLLTQKEIEQISRLQSWAALHTHLVTQLISPITGLVFALKQILNRLVCTIGQIKDEKSRKS